MDSLLKADIFFIVTSVAVVILAILAGVALVYLIRILKDVENFMENTKKMFKKWSKKIKG